MLNVGYSLSLPFLSSPTNISSSSISSSSFSLPCQSISFLFLSCLPPSLLDFSLFSLSLFFLAFPLPAFTFPRPSFILFLFLCCTSSARALQSSFPSLHCPFLTSYWAHSIGAIAVPSVTRCRCRRRCGHRCAGGVRQYSGDTW